MLRPNREVPMAAAPLGDGLHGPSQAPMPGLTPHRPTAAAGPTPVEREPEEVEGIQTFPATLQRRGAFERKEASLVRMRGQSIALQSLAEHRLDPLCIVVMFKANEESSRPGDSHPQALTEPDVNLSAHTAPTVQPPPDAAKTSAQRTAGHGGQSAEASARSAGDGAADVCISLWPSALGTGPDSAASGKAPTGSTDRSRSSNPE
jgi:hypothetical protein